MKHSMTLIAALFITAAAAVNTSAEVPEALKGSWKINDEATAKAMKASSKWTENDEKYLPRILKRMAEFRYIFEDNTLSVSFRDKTESIDVTLKSSEENIHVFIGEIKDNSFTLTVTVNDEGNITIRSSETDDMDNYVWEKCEDESGHKIKEENDTSASK